MWFENLIDRLWIRIRKNTHLPLQLYYKYWLLRCAPPW